MIIGFCFLLPPILLMFCRDKVLGRKINCAFHKGISDFAKEYAITALLLNFTAITITCKLFHHTGELVDAFHQHTLFTFHYLALIISLSIAEPVLENLIRFHIHINVVQTVYKNSSKQNLFMYLYTTALFFLNFIRIFDNAFWGDEGYTIHLAQMGVAEMIKTTAADVHPPLYYLFAQLLYHIGGNCGVIYHLSGLLPYAVLLIIACTIIRKRFGFISAIILITMSSIMKNAVIYNVEVRMYSMAALFVLLAFIALYEIIKNNKLIDWGCFCFTSLMAAYTHYYALISVAFFYAVLLPLSIKRKNIRKRLLASYVITILAYLPWLSILIKSFSRTANSWWLDNIPSLKESLLFIFDYKWICVTFFVFIIIFTLYQYDVVRITKKENEVITDTTDISIFLFENMALSDDMLWVMAGLLSIFGTLCVGLVLSYMIRPFFVLRYLFPVTPVSYLILGFCVSKMHFKKIWSFILISSILFCNLPVYMHKLQDDYTLTKENEKFLNIVNPPTEAMLYTDNYLLGLRLLSYYYPENNGIYKADAPLQLDQNYANIWLFWTKEMNDTDRINIKKQGYSLQEQYKGRFANGSTYHVYALSKNER